MPQTSIFSKAQQLKSELNYYVCLLDLIKPERTEARQLLQEKIAELRKQLPRGYCGNLFTINYLLNLEPDINFYNDSTLDFKVPRKKRFKLAALFSKIKKLFKFS